MTIVILTKPSSNQAATTLLKILEHAEKVWLYACGDGVYSIINASPLSNTIRIIIRKEGFVYASREDMEARGITIDLIIEGVRIPKDFYDQLVTDIMERADRIICI